MGRELAALGVGRVSQRIPPGPRKHAARARAGRLRCAAPGVRARQGVLRARLRAEQSARLGPYSADWHPQTSVAADGEAGVLRGPASTVKPTDLCNSGRY